MSRERFFERFSENRRITSVAAFLLIGTGSNSMRILLRDKNTGHYFAENESWTEKLEEAQSFPTGAHALSKAWRTGLKNVLAVYWFGSAAESFAIPVSSNNATK